MVIGILFMVLPMGTLGVLPFSISLVFSTLTYYKSTTSKRKFPKVLIILSVISLLVIIGNDVLFKPKVAIDQQTEIKKEDSKKEVLKDLEGL